VGAAPTTDRPVARARASVLLVSVAVAALTALFWATTAVAAPTAVSAQTATSASASISVAKPAGIVAGDVLVGTVTSRMGAAATISVPSGWTFVRRDSCTLPATQMTQAVFVRTASGYEPEWTQWSLSRAVGSSAAIAAYRGVDGSSPLAAHSGATAVNSTTATAPSVTTPAPESLVAGSFGRSGTGSVAAPSGTTQRYTVAGSGSEPAATFGLDFVRSTAGSTGSVTTSSGAASGCAIGQLVALRPAAGDLTAPTTPSSLRVTGATASSISVAWNASSDNVAVTGYNLYRDGASAGYATSTSASFTGLTCGSSYALSVEATDAAGNRSPRASLTASTSACTAPPPPSGTCTVASTSGCVPGSTITLTDTQWVCNRAISSYGRLPLKVVVNYTPGRKYGGNGAIDLVSGCAGDGNDSTIDLILDVKGDGRTYGPGIDAMKVRQTAGYTAGIQLTGRVDCGPKYTASEHQDGVQLQGGRNIAFVDFYVGNYDTGMSTCQGAGGAFFYSGAGGYSPQNIDIVRGKYIGCNHSLYTNAGTSGDITGAMFRSGRTDGTDPVCVGYAASLPCTGDGDRVTSGVTRTSVTCQRWNRTAKRWDNA
jgi:chitodextrinase